MVSRMRYPLIALRFGASCLVASRPLAGCRLLRWACCCRRGVGAGSGATLAVGVRTGRLVVGRGRLRGVDLVSLTALPPAYGGPRYLSLESTREALERLARFLDPLARDVAVQSQCLLLAAGGQQLPDGLDLVIEGSWVLGQSAQADVLVQAPEVVLEVLDAPM